MYTSLSSLPTSKRINEAKDSCRWINYRSVRNTASHRLRAEHVTDANERLNLKLVADITRDVWKDGSTVTASRSECRGDAAG
jgi:hypothetical protein